MEQWRLIHGEGGKSTLVFSEKINDQFCFDIQSGEVTIYIDDDMTLTNEGLSRSAINIEPNAKLNLYISKNTTLTVNSGFGDDGESKNPNSAEAAKGGPRRICWNSRSLDR